MDVFGKTTIYARSFNDRMQYSRSISFKDGEGTWHRVYEPVSFKGGDPGIQDGTKINVRKAFESGYTGRDGDKRKLMILEWDIAEEPRQREEPSDMFAAIDEDVPF